MDIIEETLVQQCVFCIKTSEECELIDMSVSSIVLGSEILDFEDIIRNILELKLVQDQATSICEECKNTLIQFHVFKSNARNKSNLWEDENLQKVKMYLDENDNCNETISCVRYNKCLVLVPESKKSFVQMFQLWQPQVVIEKILEMPLPSNDVVGTRTKKPKIEEIKLKEERIVGKNIIEENTIEIEVIDQFNKLDETDTDIAAPSISISEEEWLQQQYADSEMVENEDGEEIESWVCSHCSLAERFLNVNEYRSHLLAAHLGYEPEIFGDKEPDSDDLMTEDDVIAYDDSMNSTDVEVKHRELVVNDLFECAHCNFTFTNRVDYRIHQKEHVDKKTFQTSRFERLFCVDCRYQFTTQAHFQAHMNGHQLYAIVAKHSTYPICDVCNVMFCDDSSANLHQERHELGTLIDEEILSEGLFLRYGHHRAEWEQPDKELLLENALKCGHCPKRFADEESCRLHQLIFHIIILKCPVESRVFNGNQAFSIHLKNNHPELFGDEHKFACSVCKKEFATIFEKLKHMKVCDKKKYQCNHCEKRFSQKCYLMTHLRQVNGQANVVCEHCNKVCRDKGDYQIHLRSHSDVKPFHCSICPKAYKTSSARAAHLETHQESGFDCMYCATKFKSRRTLQKHCKVKHKAGSEKTVESIAAENPNKYVIEEVDIVE